VRADQTTLLETSESLQTRHDNCKVLNFPESKQVTFQAVLNICVLGWCPDLGTVSHTEQIVGATNSDEISELSGGGSAAIEKLADDIMFALHEANPEEGDENAGELLDRMFDFSREALETSVKSKDYYSECFNIDTQWGSSTENVGIFDVQCEHEFGWMINGLEVVRSEGVCGPGGARIHYTCTNIKTNRQQCTTEVSTRDELSAFNYLVQSASCPKNQAMGALTVEGNTRTMICCTGFIALSSEQDECVTVTPNWPSMCTSASDDDASRERAASLKYDHFLGSGVDCTQYFTDNQRTGQRVVLTQYRTLWSGCDHVEDKFVSTVEAQCCLASTDRAADFSDLDGLSEIEFVHNVYLVSISMDYSDSNSAIYRADTFGKADVRLSFSHAGRNGEDLYDQRHVTDDGSEFYEWIKDEEWHPMFYPILNDVKEGSGQDLVVKAVDIDKRRRGLLNDDIYTYRKDMDNIINNCATDEAGTNPPPDYANCCTGGANSGLIMCFANIVQIRGLEDK